MQSDAFQCQIEPALADQLQQWLPPLLSNLSLGRAQIAIDQLRSTLQSPTSGRIVVATARELDVSDGKSEADRLEAVEPDSDQNTPVAVAIAILPSDTLAETGISDAATMVHAGTLKGDSFAISDQIVRRLGDCLAAELARLGVSFVQWATDPRAGFENDRDAESTARWCRGFDLETIATLDYLSGPADGQARSELVKDATSPLEFSKLDFQDVSDSPIEASRPWQQLVELIQSTYAGTMDCPRLNEFRTVQQTLQGYRSAAAFDQRFWFTAIDRQTGEDAGCVILATHDKVVELVYMGLAPAARSRGFAAHLIAHAMDCAIAIGGDRLILAVDRDNTPAKRLYELAGMKPMMSEEVWCKSISKNAKPDQHRSHSETSHKRSS
ncbi:Mycothiol acetyltransferase [Rubripirellula tenax]|uniref:Mycothiol acetyltransferase n=1 Tax=Rubripirellula tenax TaxID=2528015 RepID=A0A5C6EMC8_9BACT|nr:GNAT family N-acetyltransferase [Rubripirellula tenax]TWU48791.1 Mycothiol acetyltransferase [Rubripirellula tenax]